MFVWPYVTKYNEAILDYDDIPSEKYIYSNIFDIHLFHTKYTTNTFTYVLNNNSKQFYF